MIRILLLCLVTSISYARICITTDDFCSSPAEIRIIEGFSIYKDCWQKEVHSQCYEDDYLDYCASLEQLGSCQEYHYECLKEAIDGNCNKAIRYYKCSTQSNDKEIVHFNTDYTITDELDARECTALEAKEYCQFANEICLEGKETRIIEGQEVTRDCWKWQESYTCLKDNVINNCKPYEEDKTCVLRNILPISDNHEERHYVCLEPSGQEMSYEECMKIQYCIGNNCQEVEYEQNQDMGKALSYLHMAKDAAKSLSQNRACTYDSAQCQIFKGELENCHKVIASGLTRNCCAQKKGFFEGNIMQQCPPESINLANKHRKGLCHIVGSYCAKKILGVCVDTKMQYCCFDSKIGRILQEAARDQLRIGWGTPKDPNCRAITIEEFQKLKFERIDISDLLGDMHQNINQSTLADHRDNIDQTIKNYSSKYKDRTMDYEDAISSSIKRHYGSK